MEVWKDISGFEGKYQVSTFGRVKSLHRKAWNGKVWYRLRGRILNLNSNKHYYKVSLSSKGKVRQFLVHRLVAKAFLDNTRAKPEVNHLDYNTYNNHVGNLQWVTSKENDTHKRRRSLCQK